MKWPVILLSCFFHIRPSLSPFYLSLLPHLSWSLPLCFLFLYSVSFLLSPSSFLFLPSPHLQLHFSCSLCLSLLLLRWEKFIYICFTEYESGQSVSKVLSLPLNCFGGRLVVLENVCRLSSSPWTSHTGCLTMGLRIRSLRDALFLLDFSFTFLHQSICNLNDILWLLWKYPPAHIFSQK